MTLQTIFELYETDGLLSLEAIKNIQENTSLRLDLVKHFRACQNRSFVLKLIDEMVRYRLKTDVEVSIEDLMYACYLLTLHGRIEDSCKIWQVKITDFDTYCGFDSQLVFFSGLKQTVNYLRGLDDREAQSAADFLSECSEPMDYQGNDIPWFV